MVHFIAVLLVSVVTVLALPFENDINVIFGYVILVVLWMIPFIYGALFHQAGMQSIQLFLEEEGVDVKSIVFSKKEYLLMWRGHSRVFDISYLMNGELVKRKICIGSRWLGLFSKKVYYIER